MRRWQCSLVLFIGMAALLGSARAARADNPSGGEQIVEHVLDTPRGPQRFLLHEGINANGELEVQIEHEELRALVPGETRAVVLYGRDLDGDGRIDAWFYPDKDGMIQAIDEPPPPGADGMDPKEMAWAEAAEIILQQDRYRNRWLAGLVVNAVLSKITITDAMAQSFNQELLGEEIDLRDIEVRVARLRREDPVNPAVLQTEILLSDSWGDLAQQIETQGIRDRFIDAGADIALYLSGAALAKGFGFALKWGIPKLLSSAPGIWAGAAYDSLCESLSKVAAQARDGLGATASRLGLDSDAIDQLREFVRVPAFVTAEQGIREFLTVRIPETIRGLSARGRMASLLAKSVGIIKAVAKGSFRQWRYIAATQTLQLGTEIYNRRDTLFSPNPIVFAKRVFTDKDLLQDMTFITLDVSIQTGVSAADKNVKRRMLVCGVISLLDSKATNLILSRHPDPERNALDTGWEITVGNAETQIDVTALQKFEMMAERQDNPKLALIGYAIALTDDTVGSYFYEKVTNRYETDKKAGKPMFSWIPIFAKK